MDKYCYGTIGGVHTYQIINNPVSLRVESCLSRVEQSPTDSMQNALSPSLKALIADKLLRHSDDDVKVAVASCISEITRITAPEAPYDDDQMKVSGSSLVDRKNVVGWKNSTKRGQPGSPVEISHRQSREHHPDNVYSSMETIMTLVLEESEDISLDILSPLLASIKKDNEEVFPIAQKLGERVLESCATKLRPYLVQAVKSLGMSMDDYSTVLASICQDTSDDLEKNDTHATSEHLEDKSESAKQSQEESTHVVKKDSREVTSSQQDNPDVNRSPKLVMSNGVACVGQDNALADSKSIEMQEDADCPNHSEGLNISGHEVRNDLDTEKVDISEQKPEQATKKRRRKSSSSTKSAKPSKGQVTAKKEAEKMLDDEINGKKVPSSSHEDHSVEAAGPSENDKEIDAKISSPKVCNDESDVVPSPSESVYDENHLKKLGRVKKKGSPVKEGAAEDGGASDSEVKPARRSVKKALGQNSDVKKSTVADSVKKGSGAANDADAKKHSAKKLDENKKGSGGSSKRLMEDKKKGGRGKSNSETDVAKSSAIVVDKEMVSSPRSGIKSTKDKNSEESPNTNVKRKRASGKENKSDMKEYGENLVGLRVQVWWPEDHEFYKGVIHSFDSARKKHKVLYDDGDQEILSLMKEKWKVIEADSDADGEEGSDRASLDASTDMYVL
ncbi:DNA mismatch repair protein MSH6, partial [Mucuna pruriens]